MKKMKRLFWLLPVLLTMLATGCLKDDLNERTIVLMGSEFDVKPIDSVVSDTLLVFIQDADAMAPAQVLNLPTGKTPPDIQGSYMFFPRALYAHNGHQPAANDTLYFRFGGKPTAIPQITDIVLHKGDTLFVGADTLVLPADSTIQITDTLFYYSEGQHNRTVPYEFYGDITEKDNKEELKSGIAYVMGYGNNFTMYFKIEYECKEEFSGAEFTLERGYILTGTISDLGIEHAVLACVNLKAEVTSSSSTVPNDAIESMVNRIYIYRVLGGATSPFGRAIRKEWVNP